MSEGLASFLFLIACMVSCGVVQAAAFLIEGTVSSEADGSMLEGAEVWFAQEGLVQRTQTNREGRYRFEVKQSGTFHLVALNDDFALGGHSGFAVGSAEIPLYLPRPEEVTVSIIGPSSKPLAGARLTWMNVNGLFNVPVEQLAAQGFPAGRSAGDGQLELPPLPVDGFVRLRISQFDHADLMVDYLPVKQEQPALQMMAGAPLAGRITNPDGAGVEDAEVRVFQVGISGQRDFASPRSDNEGYYRCRVPFGDYLVSARHPDYASPAPKPVEVHGDSGGEALLQMAKARKISGSVELPDGKPCGGAFVSFLKDDTVYEETFTDADGDFQMRIASPDGVLRVVPPAGFVTEQLSDIAVAMEDADTVELKPVRLREVPRLRGVVLDSKGEAVAGALLSAPRLQQPARFVTGEDGRFDFLPETLPESGAIFFTAEHPQRFEQASFIAEFAESQDVEVKLLEYKPEPELPEVEASAPAPPRPMVGEEAPDWKLEQWFGGERQTFSSLRGKVVVLAFWASFDDSPQGVDTVNFFNRLHDIYGADEQVAIIGIHDATSTQEEVKAFMEGYPVFFPFAMDTQQFETFSNYKVTFIPDVVLIDKKGKIRYRQPGEKLPELIKILRRE